MRCNIQPKTEPQKKLKRRNSAASEAPSAPAVGFTEVEADGDEVGQGLCVFVILAQRILHACRMRATCEDDLG